jgi:hypothetical protein
MKQKRIIFALAIIILVMLLSIVCGWPMMQVNSFYTAEAQAVPQFDAFNSIIFSTIPLPNGAVELEQYSVGIISPTTSHGRYLITRYQLAQSHQDIVINHYQEFFLANGWELFFEDMVRERQSRSYFRETSCVAVYFYDEDKYVLEIWHDFWKQDFSPPNPAIWLFSLFEGGKSGFATCPP